MRRREFTTLLGGAAVAWPLALRAQQPAAVPVIGFVNSGTSAANTYTVAALRQSLKEAGLVGGGDRREHAVGPACQGGNHDDPDRLHYAR